MPTLPSPFQMVVTYLAMERLTSFMDGSPLYAHQFIIPDTGYEGTLYVGIHGNAYIHWDFDDLLVCTEAYIAEDLARDVILATARGLQRLVVEDMLSN